MRFLSPHGEASSPGLGAFRAHGTASTGGEAKLDLDDLLITRPGWRPTATDLPLRTAGLFVFPVNREIGESIAVLFSCLPPIILGGRPHQLYLIYRLAGNQRFGIRISSIYEMVRMASKSRWSKTA